MTPKYDPLTAEDSHLEALLAFDRDLASEHRPLAGDGASSSLRAVHECQRLLEEVWPRSDTPSVSLPARLGRFTILRELGRGGFGVVFLAVDTILRRQVALKVPRPGVLTTPDLRQRFLREAEAASRLDHPHIVPVYEVGEDGPVFFIASAYCDGPTLAEWLRRRTAPVPFTEAARLVSILGAAVAHAHHRDILHRDLKPGNILLQSGEAESSGNEGACDSLGYVPRICDFGLAKLLDQVSQETSSGIAIGSASYMAPEQAAGRLREQGPATDVYALGAILYELLTGRPPFRGETDLETLRLVSDEEPPSPRTLRHGLPRDLETICSKCLEKPSHRRYASAWELTEDLRRFLDGKPVRARPVPAWQRAGKWAKRRPVHAALAVVIAVAAFGVLGVLLGSDAWLRRHNRRLHEAVAQAERDAQTAERSAQEARIEVARLEERVHFGRRFGQATLMKLIHETFESGKVRVAEKLFDNLRPAAGQPEPRGFAWGYLRGLFRPEVSLLGKAQPWHYEPILQVAIAHDGRTLAAGFADGRVILWDLIQDRLLHALNHRDPGTWDQVYFLAFSPDGRSLASGSPRRNSVKLWDVSSGRLRAAILADGEGTEFQQLFALRFADTSDCLGMFGKGPADGTFNVLFWSLPAAGGRPVLKARLSWKHLASFNHDGTLKEPAWTRDAEASAPWLAYARTHLFLLDDRASFAIRDEPTDATLFEPSYYLPVARIRGPLKAPVLQERGFAELTQDEIRQFSRQAHQVLGSISKQYPSAMGPFHLPKYAPDGRTVAAYVDSLGVVLNDVASGHAMTVYAPKPNWRVVDMAFTPDGRSLVMAGFHPQIHVWRLKPSSLPGHQKEVWGLAFSPDGTTLASAADDSTIQLWDVADGPGRATLEGHGSLVTTVAYSPDGKLLASAGFDHTVRIWDASTRELLAILRGHQDHVRSLAFSPDGGTLATGGDDRTVRLWDVATRRELAPPLVGHTGKVCSLAFAPDRKTLYSGCLDETIRVWDWAAGSVRAVWKAGDQVESLAIAPDGQTLAVGLHNGNLTLWDVATEKAGPPLHGHAGDVLGLTFSPDGLTLASAGRDQTVRLWEPVTGQELMVLKGHVASVHAIAFSPDGMTLATGSHDGAIKLWRALPDRAHQTADSEKRQRPEPR